MPRAPTLYDVLGAAPGAADADLRKCYKQLALRHHPDRRGDSAEPDADATELMAKINHAREILCDPATRAAYDAKLARAGAG